MIVVKFYGIVQGVGFRPYIYKKAMEFSAKGRVCNCQSCVQLKLNEDININEFISSIKKKGSRLD